MVDGGRHSDGVTVGRDDAEMRRAVVVLQTEVGAVELWVADREEVVDLEEGVLGVAVRGDVGHNLSGKKSRAIFNFWEKVRRLLLTWLSFYQF